MKELCCKCNVLYNSILSVSHMEQVTYICLANCHVVPPLEDSLLGLHSVTLCDWVKVDNTKTCLQNLRYNNVLK